jgi:hypothetical protein
MNRRASALLCLVFFLGCGRVLADEGMWLFNAFPADRVKARYGFEITQPWLDHVRLSSVRFNNGGSGSFVSADGLTFTNHHVGAACIHQLSTNGKDYVKTGFYGATPGEEARCPDLELNVLVGIEDVSSRVQAAAKPGMSSADAGQAQRAAMSTIEQECASKTGMRCDVVTLYSGERYHLHRYKTSPDVRLVFAPEFDMAFFGGDPDNFTYPRYDLDITFFRVYENNQPAHLDNYFHWSSAGVKENDLLFVPGNPGSTGRLLTMAQLEFLRDLDYPSRLQVYQRRIQVLQKFAGESAENARIAQEQIFGYQNGFKALTGYQSGLKDAQLMQKKQADEQQLRGFVNSRADLKAKLGDPWQQIAGAVQVNRDIYLPLTYLERMRGFNSQLATYARDLVRAAAEKKKPNPDRLREYRDSALPSLEQHLFSTAPVYKSLETATLADSLAGLQEALGADNEMVRKTLNRKSADAAAGELIAGTKLDQAPVRKQLYESGEAAIQSSTDPLIVLMRDLEPQARAARKEYDDQVDSVFRTRGAEIARARFAQGGFNEPPDATFTLRLSYGAVKGYTEAGKPVPYFTAIGGAYQHAQANGNRPPYQLPESWTSHKSKLNLSTPLNFVSTADIIGGNSGSPAVNRAGEVVGIVFDGNLQSLPWNFIYDDREARSVQVDSRGIVETLRNVYGATRVVEELQSGKAAAAEK